MYKKRMMLQLFDDGTGAGSGGQGGNAGTGNGGQGSAGAHPEHMVPEHILMNSWKKLQVHVLRNLREPRLRTFSEVRV